MCSLLLNYTFLLFNLCVAPILSGGGAIKDGRYRFSVQIGTCDRSPQNSPHPSTGALCSVYFCTELCSRGIEIILRQICARADRASVVEHWVCRSPARGARRGKTNPGKSIISHQWPKWSIDLFCELCRCEVKTVPSRQILPSRFRQ
jgi:hypothetical protein